ncbi:MAG: hypothetical protein ABEI98_10410 [Halorhabdus sp.]
MERHPARRRAVSYVRESLATFGVGFVTLSVLTAGVLLAAAGRGMTAVASAVVALTFTTLVFTEYGVCEDERDEDGDIDLTSLGVAGKLAVVAAVAVHLNALMAVAVVVGTVAPSGWVFAAVGGYVVYDLLIVRFGVPLSVTGLAAVLFAAGALLAQLIDTLDWQRLTPTNVVFSQLRRRQDTS